MRVVWFSLGLVACRPYVPPPVTPPLQVAQAPLRQARVAGENAGVSLVVRAGSAYDPPGREGLAFALAQVAALRLGATVEVEVERVVFQLPPQLPADPVAALLAPVTAHELEYAQALAMGRLRSSDCDAVARDAGLSWLFAGHPYGHGPAGRLSTVPTLRAAELTSFYAARYVRDAVVVAITGEQTAIPALDGAFAPRLSRSPVPAVLPTMARENLVVEAEVVGACAFVAMQPARRTRHSAAALVQLAGLQGWTHGLPAVDPLAWAVLPWSTEKHDFTFPPLTAAGDEPAGGGPPPSAVDVAWTVLLDAVPRLAPELAAPAPEPGWWAEEGVLSVVVVTPDASGWRVRESSDTFVVLDREAALR